MKQPLKNEKLTSLYQAILSLETEDECRDFFEDLCTITELEEMSRRLHAAKLLSSGHVYADIAAMTGLSTATICRVSMCLKHGSDGYRTVLARTTKTGTEDENHEQ